MIKSIAIANMLNNGWKDQHYQPFREGIDVCYLLQGDNLPGDPTIALLRYEAGASVPRHEHTGVETIIVLEGTQSDESAVYETGSLVINPVGSRHSVWSDNGCVVLIQWDRPVKFV